MRRRRSTTRPAARTLPSCRFRRRGRRASPTSANAESKRLTTARPDGPQRQVAQSRQMSRLAQRDGGGEATACSRLVQQIDVSPTVRLGRLRDSSSDQTLLGGRVQFAVMRPASASRSRPRATAADRRPRRLSRRRPVRGESSAGTGRFAFARNRLPFTSCARSTNPRRNSTVSQAGGSEFLPPRLSCAFNARTDGASARSNVRRRPAPGEFDLHADELRPRRVVVLLQPVSIRQPGQVIVWRGREWPPGARCRRSFGRALRLKSPRAAKPYV